MPASMTKSGFIPAAVMRPRIVMQPELKQACSMRKIIKVSPSTGPCNQRAFVFCSAF
ncbi:hypothetical protein BOSE21B_30521 [Bosea sp. 21B]|nr:hypothetical protein BOSE21B_30521 [Bosea sp. 21B]